ncbi:helix-turn-helix domain-containing protein [Streptomyces longispororuber]|uniref:helix-turn-helix domain-containing protein n=1 Tax=Streptomyces longispororuber TaxID=68230 RepID=UPI00210CD0EB|nr:helix-turn-helix domain-containing protein [Streptomyces longispororuber]MCQ4209196.1 helix-turn-helix domain-containing protein [Streptomyces longispororuber]
MSRWKQLPASMEPRQRQLTVQLRRFKDRSGLTLRAVAARTGYSRSSWDRYLNGRALPPRQAVEAFARACDGDPVRLLALHEVAAERGGGAGALPEAPTDALPGAGPDAAPEAADAGPVRGLRRPGLVVGAAVIAAVVVAALALALVLVRPWGDGGERAAAPKEFVFKAGVDHPCKVHRAGDGLLYAGYSRTRTGLIGPQSAQWPVVEAQCLLRHRGLAPGIADGFFGPRTGRAVQRLQKRAHLVVDGIVGEDTWKALRT